MIRLRAIATNTFREAIRDRVLSSLLFFAVLVIMGSLAVESITIGDQAKVVRSFAFGAIRFFGAMIALFLGVGLVYKELERKTIYTIVSKPIGRGLFLMGKFTGLMAVIGVQLLAMGGLYVLLMSLSQGPPHSGFYTALMLVWIELGLLVAWTILFSTSSTPTTATLFSLSVFFIGNLADDIWYYGQKADSESLRMVAEGLYWALPNFQILNGSHAAIHEQTITYSQFAASLSYGLGYTVAVLSLAVFVFSRRDFK
jgi:ABC-type transport system involved in multi-copper enzyme maturation permease subunit